MANKKTKNISNNHIDDTVSLAMLELLELAMLEFENNGNLENNKKKPNNLELKIEYDNNEDDFNPTDLSSIIIHARKVEQKNNQLKWVDPYKKVGDEMYKNIAKDMFPSQEGQKYVNLKWSDIKQNNNDFDAYLSLNTQLKKYYNENNKFNKSMLKIINDKYFKQQFPLMEISYDRKSIYKTDNFAQQNQKIFSYK